jgi:hypothetical protein
MKPFRPRAMAFAHVFLGHSPRLRGKSCFGFEIGELTVKAL